MNEDCCATYSNAFPDVALRPVRSHDVAFRRFSGIDLVAGGPPCQPFSSGGKRLASQDVRDMIPEYVRAVREARPRAFLMENVYGLFGSAHYDYFGAVLGSLTKLGYVVAAAVINSAAYGVPQKRRRVFVVGLRKGKFEFLQPTHGPGTGQPYVPAGSILKKGKVIGEPNPSRVFYAKRPDLRPSPYDGHIFNGGGRPVDLNAPCHTILASAGGNKTHFIDTLSLVPEYHAHVLRGGKPRTGVLEGARRLTAEESALIQTFPSWFRFLGSRSARYTQIGNAVPPKLAEVIGIALRAALT
jgi:DNA (cytosine-5)-methyltransferase 1